MSAIFSATAAARGITGRSCTTWQRMRGELLMQINADLKSPFNERSEL